MFLAFLTNLEIHNVIVMDWSNEDELLYYDTVQNIRPIAADIATLMTSINQMLGDDGLPQEHDYHLVGFGFGAHLAGVAGSMLSNAITIRRITGTSMVNWYDQSGITVHAWLLVDG